MSQDAEPVARLASQASDGSMPSLTAESTDLKIPSFWFLNLGGWFCWGIGLAISTIPVWSDHQSSLFRIVDFLSTFLCSFPLHAVCKALWNRRVGFFHSMAVCALVCLPFGILISAVTLWTEQLGGNVRINFSMSYVLVYMMGGATVLMAWSGLYFGIKYYQRASDERARALSSAALAREAELRALRFQLQPHFLFNSLNALAVLIRDRETDSASRMVDLLGDMLRRTLRPGQTNDTSLREEIEFISGYLEIEETRFSDRLQVEWDIEDAARNCLVPTLILQPLVENAVRHGIASRVEAGRIRIVGRIESGVLRIAVIDNGKGFTSKALTEGVGLTNTRERLRMLFGSSASLVLSSVAGGGAEVTVQLPVRTRM